MKSKLMILMPAFQVKFLTLVYFIIHNFGILIHCLFLFYCLFLDYEIMRKCLEVELEEEIKLGKERDSYLVQVEQTKVHNLQMANNWLASTPTSADNGNTLLEMEENINSTLEALECALKEMDILRTRKAAINKANRILREDFMQKKADWEDRMTKQKNVIKIMLLRDFFFLFLSFLVLILIEVYVYPCLFLFCFAGI